MAGKNDIDARTKAAREALDKAATLLMEHGEILVMMVQASALQEQERKKVDQGASLYAAPWQEMGPGEGIEIEDPLGTQYLQDMIRAGAYFAGSWERLTRHVEFMNTHLRRHIHE